MSSSFNVNAYIILTFLHGCQSSHGRRKWMPHKFHMVVKARQIRS